MIGALTLAQTLTNLIISPAATGLPRGWKVTHLPGVQSPSFEVTRGHTLRIVAIGQGGTATYRLRQSIPAPASSRQHGVLTWRWRAGTPLRGADLKRRDTDDSPIRVVVTFQDGRSIAYSWGNREGRHESFASWSSRDRMIVVLQRAEDADGSWHVEQCDPFTDYRRLWNRGPKAIVAVGIGGDSDGLKIRAAAEIGDITWEGP